MKVIADLCIVPIGVGVSVSQYIVACEKVLLDHGVSPKLTLTEPISRANGKL